MATGRSPLTPLVEAAGRTAATIGYHAGAAWHAATLPYRATVQTWRRTTHALREAYSTRLREQALPYGADSPTGGAIDPDDWSYRRLSQARRDLLPITQARSLELAHWLWQRNPIARRILELTRDFVVGDGAQVSSDVPAVQEVLDAFWRDSVNDLDAFQDDLALELAKAGELFVPVFVNEDNGAVRLGWLDPANVAAVLHDPANCRVPLAVKVRSAHEAGGYEYLKIIREQDDPGQSGQGRLMPAQPNETLIDPASGSDQAQSYAGSCVVVTINHPPGATRGTSDLLHLTDWLDAYDSALFASLDRTALLNCFVWDVSVENAQEPELQRMRDSEPPPRPGSVRYHNDKVTWNAVTPNLGMHDFAKGIVTFKNQIAAGAGIGAHWLGASDDVNRATSQSMDGPTMRRLTKRQLVVRRVLELLCRFAVDQAVVAKQLDEEYPVTNDAGAETSTVAARDAFTVALPELSEKDTASWSTAVLQTMQGLQLALDTGLLGTKTAREVLASLLQQAGIAVDLAQEAKEVEQEQAEKAAQAAAMAPPALPTGAAPAPGQSGRTKPVAVPAAATGAAAETPAREAIAA